LSKKFLANQQRRNGVKNARNARFRAAGFFEALLDFLDKKNSTAQQKGFE
jgi:hypothetical protein